MEQIEFIAWSERAKESCSNENGEMAPVKLVGTDR